jgi:hypothetical protein
MQREISSTEIIRNIRGTAAKENSSKACPLRLGLFLLFIYWSLSLTSAVRVIEVIPEIGNPKSFGSWYVTDTNVAGWLSILVVDPEHGVLPSQ